MRVGLLIVGGAVAIIGYALIYSALTTIDPGLSACPDGPMGVLDSLKPKLDCSRLRSAGLGLGKVGLGGQYTCDPGQHWVGDPVNGGCVSDKVPGVKV